MYTSAMKQYSKKAFEAEGYPDWVRGRYKQMMEHGKTQVKFLGAALQIGRHGRDSGKANEKVEECNFSFNFRNVKEFVEESLQVETIITSGLAGILGLMDTKVCIHPLKW
jgi:hypothetical protein